MTRSLLDRLACAGVLIALAASLHPIGSAQGADAKAGREKARMCAACHGLTGKATQPDAPNLTGDSPVYLENQLQAYRSGKREHEQMSVIAQSLSDEDIADLAAWYGSLEYTVTTPAN